MNTKVITYGFAFIAVSLALVFVRQENATDLTASIDLLASSSGQPGLPQSSSRVISTVATAKKAMVTSLVTPSVLVTMSPIPMVTQTVSPKPVLVSPSLSPSISPGISIKPAVSPSPTPATPSPMVTPSGEPLSPSPSSDLVVINEVAWMGTPTSATDEWIELYNGTSHIVDLSGWVLRSRTGQSPDPVITLEGTIQPYGYFLLERTDDATISDVSADQIYTGALNNNPTGELLELLNNQGAIVDSIDNGGQDWYAGENSTKASMERVNSSQKGTISGNWRTYANTSGVSYDTGGKPILGTPRARNSVTSQ